MQMKVGFFVLGVSVLGSAVSAQAYCEDLWLARNSIMNDNGYCFGTPLGKAIFDNSDCSTKSPKLSAQESRRVAAIQNQEKLDECKVNTKKTSLDIELFELRQKLVIQPIIDGFESSCVKYNGQSPIPLYADQDTNSQILGHVQPGDSVNFSHYSEEDKPGWGFASYVWAEDYLNPRLGWHIDPIDKCEAFAG